MWSDQCMPGQLEIERYLALIRRGKKDDNEGKDSGLIQGQLVKKLSINEQSNVFIFQYNFNLNFIEVLRRLLNLARLNLCNL